MKNLNYFPFERNRYYYGKLLGEQDFVDEQRYLNDKRRLQNRVMFGAGAAAGLEVVAVDEKSISVEAGLAFDFSGREILVDVPVLRRLSAIDGFDALVGQEKRRYLYLCIEYDEQEIIPAHNVMSGTAAGSGQQDYEKYKEGYHLYLTAKEPEEPVLTRQSLTEQSCVLYQDERFRITQRLPRFVTAGAQFETSVTVENLGESRRFSGRIAEELSCAEIGGKRSLLFSFEEQLLEKGGRAEQRLWLTAAALCSGKAGFQLSPDGFSMESEQAALSLREERKLSAEILSGGEEEAVERLYYRNLMEDVIRDDYPQGLYLARILLLHHERTYLIDGVEDLLHGQRLPSSALLAGRLDLLEKRLGRTAAQSGGGTAGAAGGFASGVVSTQGGGSLPESMPDSAAQVPHTADRGKLPAVRYGTAEIALGIGAKRGQRFFSHEIFHGLGLGPVQISLSIEEENRLYSGSPEIFEQMQVRAELGARADMEKGSFVIGLRMIEPPSQQRVRVHWRAEALGQQEKEQTAGRRLFIRPERLELHLRENTWLEALCPGIPGLSVNWSVKTAEGGSITQDGMYTAPNLPGVYEISAASAEFPELRTSVFAIVRE